MIDPAHIRRKFSNTTDVPLSRKGGLKNWFRRKFSCSEPFPTGCLDPFDFNQKLLALFNKPDVIPLIAITTGQPNLTADSIIQRVNKYRSDTRPYERIELNNVDELGDIFYFSPNNNDENTHGREIKDLVISKDVEVKIKNAFIGNLNITHNNSILFLENCRIGTLDIAQDARTHIKINDCQIGILRLGNASTTDFVIKGGVVEYVETVPPGQGTPFAGIAHIDQVYFPTHEQDSPMYYTPQTYSTLRYHFDDMQNTPIANIMRALELESERSNEKGINALFSWFYGIFSGYGSKPGRAALWFGITMLVTTVAIALFDGGTLGLSHDSTNKTANYYVGSRAVLNDPRFGNWARGLYLALQAPFNPLGIFAARKLVLASTYWGSIALIFHSIFTDAMLIMVVMAVRRRFKMK